MSGYPLRCCAAIFSPAWTALFGALARSGRMATKAGGLSRSVVTSWMRGTDRAVCCQVQGIHTIAPPMMSPARPVTSARRFESAATIPMSETAAPAAPPYAPQRKTVKAVDNGHQPHL